MDQDLTYEDAVGHCEKVLIHGHLYKADVFVAELRGKRIVVKDFAKKGFWERNLVGRLVINREFRAYRALSGVEGLAERFKKLSPFSLAVEYLDGRDLGRVERGELSPGIILQMERIVEDLHERGWVHLDLQRRSNILMVGGNLFVIDLASAFHPGGVPVIGRCLTRILGFSDRLALVKMKNLFAPEFLSAQEQKWLRIRNRIMSTPW